MQLVRNLIIVLIIQGLHCVIMETLIKRLSWRIKIIIPDWRGYHLSASGRAFWFHDHVRAVVLIQIINDFRLLFWAELLLFTTQFWLIVFDTWCRHSGYAKYFICVFVHLICTGRWWLWAQLYIEIRLFFTYVLGIQEFFLINLVHLKLVLKISNSKVVWHRRFLDMIHLKHWRWPLVPISLLLIHFVWN